MSEDAEGQWGPWTRAVVQGATLLLEAKEGGPSREGNPGREAREGGHSGGGASAHGAPAHASLREREAIPWGRNMQVWP